ncbi:MAG: fluoride efflux transporter CrcB [Planctomycetales bacterium]
MWQKLLLIALAGSLGTLARFGVSQLANHWAGQGFPWGTLIVNSLGCFLFGLIWTLPEAYLSQEWKVVVLTGFMGSLTTFSTYSFECVDLAEHGKWSLAAGNLGVQLIAGLACVVIGLSVGRRM